MNALGLSSYLHLFPVNIAEIILLNQGQELNCGVSFLGIISVTVFLNIYI